MKIQNLVFILLSVMGLVVLVSALASLITGLAHNLVLVAVLAVVSYLLTPLFFALSVQGNEITVQDYFGTLLGLTLLIVAAGVAIGVIAIMSTL